MVNDDKSFLAFLNSHQFLHLLILFMTATTLFTCHKITEGHTAARRVCQVKVTLNSL